MPFTSTSPMAALRILEVGVVSNKRLRASRRNPETKKYKPPAIASDERIASSLIGMKRAKQTATVFPRLFSEELAAYLLGVGHVDGDGAAASLGIAGSVDAPSVLVGKLDEAGGLTFRFLADFLHAHFLNNFEAGTRRLDCGNVRGSVHESVWRISVADGSGCELKRIFVREPSG